jgi:hypothetical protein
MSGETIVVRGVQKTLEAAGAAITNLAVSAAATNPYNSEIDGASFPDAEFVLMVTFTTNPVEGSTITLNAQPTAIDGTNNSLVPLANRSVRFMGSFVVGAQTAAQYLLLNANNVPRSANYYLTNNATGQTIAAGWTLKVTPKSYKAA